MWPAYCDQYMGNLYGWSNSGCGIQDPSCDLLSALSAGSARYKTLLAGLEDGISKPVNAAGRKPKHMFILPGGVADIFLEKE